MTAAYEYWHGKQKTTPYADGYYYPRRIVYLGHQMWKRTGIVPDPRQIVDIDPRWLSDLLTRDDLIESARPKPEANQ